MNPIYRIKANNKAEPILSIPASSITKASINTVIKLEGIISIISLIIFDLGSLSFPTSLSHIFPKAKGKYQKKYVMK